MELLKNDNRRFALAAAGALAFTAGGILLGQTLFDTSPDAAEPAGEAGEHGEAEENHGPEGFVAIDGARAQAAGIITEIVRSGGLGSEIIAQGVVAATPEGESVLTARADGTIVRINRRLGDYVNAGQAVAVMESREASSIASERSAAAARLALARSTYDREKRLYDAKVTARQDLEGAQAALAEAQAEVRRTQAAAGAARVSGDGRTLSVVSLVSGQVTKSDAKLGAFVAAGTELFRVANPNSIQINASVLPADAARIRPGVVAVLELPGGNTRSATVRSITPGLDPESRSLTAVLQPAGVAGLSQGQGLRVRIRSGEDGDGRITLPEEAVQSVEGRDVVFVKTAKGFQATNVATGQRSGGRIEVVSGLRPGVTIATRNAFLLKAELGKGEAEH